MAKRNRSTTQAVIDRRIQEGRGQGTGATYQPWLLVQDVPSKGLAHRIKGWKTKRVHHLFSNHERDYFYILEWSAFVQDIREQYPLLPLEETLTIAEENLIRHPVDPKTRQPIVMTTDFLVTVVRDGSPVNQARSVKPVNQLNKTRVLEKLELERLYWQKRDIDWGIVTEREIPQTIADNVRLLHGYHSLADRPLSTGDIDTIGTVLTRQVRAEESPLRDIAAECDQLLGYEPGTCLTVAYYLLANHHWNTDLNRPLDPGAALVLLDTTIERAGVA